jgi:hypothetical protein
MGWVISGTGDPALRRGAGMGSPRVVGIGRSQTLTPRDRAVPHTPLRCGIGRLRTPLFGPLGEGVPVPPDPPRDRAVPEPQAPPRNRAFPLSTSTKEHQFPLSISTKEHKKPPGADLRTPKNTKEHHDMAWGPPPKAADIYGSDVRWPILQRCHFAIGDLDPNNTKLFIGISGGLCFACDFSASRNPP